MGCRSGATKDVGNSGEVIVSACQRYCITYRVKRQSLVRQALRLRSGQAHHRRVRQAGVFQFRGEFAPVIASPAGAKQSLR